MWQLKQLMIDQTSVIMGTLMFLRVWLWLAVAAVAPAQRSSTRGPAHSESPADLLRRLSELNVALETLSRAPALQAAPRPPSEKREAEGRIPSLPLMREPSSKSVEQMVRLGGSSADQEFREDLKAYKARRKLSPLMLLAFMAEPGVEADVEDHEGLAVCATLRANHELERALEPARAASVPRNL